MARVIGITGKSGSGKTHLCRLLSTFGYHTESADLINRELLAKSEVIEGLEQALQCFLRTEENQIDKDQILLKLLSNPGDRVRIEQFLHPLIYAELQTRLASKNTDEWVFFEGALLCDHGFQKDLLDACILVKCPLEVCYQRLVGGRSWTPWRSRALLNIQKTDEEKVKNVTHIFSGLSIKPEAVRELLDNLETYFKRDSLSQ